MSRGRSRLALWLRRAWLRVVKLTHPVIGPFRERWRRSLKLRTMAVTGLVTGVMIVIAGTFILTSIGDDLYSARRDQVLQDSARATVSAQQLLDASDASEHSTLAALMTSMRRAVSDTTSSQMFAVRRQPGQAATAEVPQDFSTEIALGDLITPDLAKALHSGEAPQYWQPVELDTPSGEPGPGIIVGSTLTFPGAAGTYDLYIGHSLAETQSTLEFIQRTLMITAVILMLLIGVLVWTMTRIVFRPIRAAADTSRRLAAGETQVRMPRQNDEQFDLLSDSFNHMADTLQQRIAELDELSEMQQRFVSDVSHELRTPLTTIRLASEVLSAKASEMDPAQARSVELLRTQVDRFERLLTDLLEISRYDAGRVTLETEQTNLVRLTEEVCEGLQPLSPSLIEVRALGGYAPIEVDPRRIRRIVTNLVGNAIEHGEGNAVVVTIDSNQSAVALTVRDWGVGMSAEATEHVFDRFWRADPSRKRTLGGTGLGLAIALEDAAVHGGQLEVWSEAGVGTNFRLTLPRSEGAASFLSPLPLIADEHLTAAGDPQSTGGWLRRPMRNLGKRRRS